MGESHTTLWQNMKSNIERYLGSSTKLMLIKCE